FSGIFAQNLRRTYRTVFQEGLERTAQLPKDTITKEDMAHLPELLQNYLELSGVTGQERVNNVRIVFHGRMRSNPDDEWMHFKSEQYNFFDSATRAFYIKAKKKGIPANGLHLYRNGKAFMTIKLAGLLKIIDVDGLEMDQSETVTFLNDICFFAPAVLVNHDSISWRVLDSNRLEATYNNGSQTVGATLIFDEAGWLINFISHDRFEIVGTEVNQRTWFTPVEMYGTFGDNTLPRQAGAYYQHPDQDFCYGEFTTVEVDYNIAPDE
ncbi:MAG: hypothetical protein RQ866_04640, partial [Bacteroidales bacterium]|nr:hypothetical protein [Bacteroidales bacterium]